ncbi:MAG TPA: transposase [Pirellulales bacterium]|jgi:putative transposase|nr:transposase [Pirellulales bacterium]
MLDALCLGHVRGQFDLWAYCIMPEHVHILLLPRTDIKISQVLTTIKQSVSKRAIIWLRENRPEFLPRIEDLQPNGRRAHRFWQRGGGYDRNLRSVSGIHEKAAYIHRNPVRRGLVATPEEWPWSSALAWATGRDEPIAIDRGSFPPLIVAR